MTQAAERDVATVEELATFIKSARSLSIVGGTTKHLFMYGPEHIRHFMPSWLRSLRGGAQMDLDTPYGKAHAWIEDDEIDMLGHGVIYHPDGQRALHLETLVVLYDDVPKDRDRQEHILRVHWKR